MSAAQVKHRNNFGVLRLLFATLVIVAHSPELIDGDRSRELLTRIFDTMSFGEVAVDGFFLISGYLITKSFCQTPNAGGFMARRVLRIVPGYLVSFWLCLLALPLLFGPLQTGTLRLAHNVGQSLFLQKPEGPTIFAGQPGDDLNGAMWTISYEFRCYLAVLLVGLAARALPFRPATLRLVLLAAVAAGLAANAYGLFDGIDNAHQRVIGRVDYDCRFGAIFGVGALFYLYRDRVPLNGRGAIVAALLLLPAMFSDTLAEAAFAVLGGYLIFAFAFKARAVRTRLADDRTDLSYGIYLYAWPIQNSLIRTFPAIHPAVLALVTIVLAGVCGYLSWRLVEQPALGLVRRAPRLRLQAAAS